MNSVKLPKNYCGPAVVVGGGIIMLLALTSMVWLLGQDGRFWQCTAAMAPSGQPACGKEPGCTLVIVKGHPVFVCRWGSSLQGCAEYW